MNELYYYKIYIKINAQDFKRINKVKANQCWLI